MVTTWSDGERKVRATRVARSGILTGRAHCAADVQDRRVGSSNRLEADVPWAAVGRRTAANPI